jgi:hypothetical protein
MSCMELSERDRSLLRLDQKPRQSTLSYPVPSKFSRSCHIQSRALLDFRSVRTVFCAKIPRIDDMQPVASCSFIHFDIHVA